MRMTLKELKLYTKLNDLATWNFIYIYIYIYAVCASPINKISAVHGALLEMLVCMLKVLL